MSRYYRGKHETQEGHKRKRAGGLTGGQKALIVLIAVLSLALVLALVYKSIFVKPAISWYARARVSFAHFGS